MTTPASKQRDNKNIKEAHKGANKERKRIKRKKKQVEAQKGANKHVIKQKKGS